MTARTPYRHRESFPGGSSRAQALGRSILDTARGFPYSRRLNAHASCVNALAFSRGSGQFLASGGDDLKICLWNFHQDDVTEPSHTLRGPNNNIFTLEFSTNNKFLFAGGSSNVVHKYDVATLGSQVESFKNFEPDQTFNHHDDSVRIVTCHAVRDEIFMTGGEDGTIHRFDLRQPGRGDVVDLRSEVTGAQYHPTIEHLFVTSDHRGNVCLWDSRMTFSSGSRTAMEGVVRRYTTRLTRQGSPNLCNPEASSVVFDKDGSKLAVSFVHYFPTIYALGDPNPLAVLTGETLPDGSPIPEGERTYTNSCTMKHGAFGGFGLGEDDLYGGGSDDFRAYIWRIPSLSCLQEQRTVLSANEWHSSSQLRGIAFTDTCSSEKVLPVGISRPMCRLTGHDSIINSVVFHPHFLHIVTAGVEKRIVLHSPTPSSPCTRDLPPSPSNVRQLAAEDSEQDRRAYLMALLESSMDSDDESDSTIDHNERRTLSLFDHLLREEGQADVFVVRRLLTDPGLQTEETSSSSDSDTEESLDGDLVYDF